MPRTDDELMALLRDPANPRTPLHFKMLDHQVGGGGGLAARNAASAFHRTTGYACGISMGAPKPISKLFGDIDV